jgi:hypothetical protein
MPVDYKRNHNSSNNYKNNKMHSKDSVKNPINKTFLDSYSYISFVNCDILSELQWNPIAAKCFIKWHLIDGKIWSATQFAEVDLRINSKCWIFVRLYFLKNLPCNIVLGLDAWPMLPSTLTLYGAIILKGFSQVGTHRAEPKLKKGKGVEMAEADTLSRYVAGALLYHAPSAYVTTL